MVINPLSARIFTVFGHSLLEDRVLHKEAWVTKLLGTHLSIQVHKKVKFSWRDNSTLALKGLIECVIIYSKPLKSKSLDMIISLFITFRDLEVQQNY